MKILWMTWKDGAHPLAGGAEVVNEELAKRLVADGHEVVFLVGGFKGGVAEELVNGYKIIRLGNRYSVYWLAYRYYKRNLVGWADLVIDEVNTVPFMAKFYVKEPNMLLVYMLCRQIWFYQLPPPFNLIGYLIEPVYLWLLRDRKVSTESQSTKNDLLKFGFKLRQVHIFSIGIEMEPVADLKKIEKYSNPTLLSLGAIRSMKRTHHQIKAFELAKHKIPNLKLKIAGESNSNYGRKVLELAKASQYRDDIEYVGKVDLKHKVELLQKSHLIMATSVKEGWGLVVTEANSQGTPAVAYDVDGLRDSVKNGKTGWLTAINPRVLADQLVEALGNEQSYQMVRQAAWECSKEFNFENSYKEFKAAIEL